MEECRAALPLYLASAKSAKGSYTGSRARGAMLILLTFCPDCNEPAMEVVEHRPNDSYEARCTACGCEIFGKISAELLIAKRTVESTR
jgi:hypothetical protein